MVKITKNLVPEDKYKIKCPYTMKPGYITVHNTANDASAKNEIAYMIRNNNQTSFHFAVDDIEAVQGLPLDRNGWHAGDGNGSGNRKSIGIEICYSKSGGDRFIKAEKNAAELIAQLLKDYNWDIDKVMKHQDWSKKYCPHRTLDMGWDRFIKMIEDKLNEGKAPVKSIDEVAKDVIAGKYGNQPERQKKLEAEGYNYEEVRRRVNELLKPKKEIFKKGDTVVPLKLVDINGKRLIQYDREYIITQLNGNRATLSAKRNGKLYIWAVMSTNNIKKI